MPQDQEFPSESKRVVTIRELATVLFRRRRFLLGCGVVTLALALLSMWLMPSYKATMKLLVQRDRQDPLVSSSQEMQNPLAPASQPVSEEDLNSEVELLTSDDVLRQVASDCGLQNGRFWQGLFMKLNDDQRLALATKNLARALKTEPVNRANIINVSFSSSDPQMAARVLQKLRDVYLAKHTAVRRPTGQYDVYNQEAKTYEQDLQASEAALSDFTTKYGAVAPEQQREIVVQKKNEFAATLAQTKAAIAEARNEISNLQKQSSVLPTRLVTQLRHSDNPQLLEQLKSTLLTLQLKRIDLLTKYQPDYRPVQDLEKQIAETQQAIQKEESAPVREETTDQNPTQSLVESELAKDRATLAGLQARAEATEEIVSRYEEQAKELDRLTLVRDDLQRNHKILEQNYLLYVSKREQARTGDLLDKNRILNVTVADDPNTPALPSHNPLLYGIVVTFGCLLLAAGALFAVEQFDPSFQSPLQIESALGMPVLAAIPTNSLLRSDPDDGMLEGEILKPPRRRDRIGA